jgi:hypothetical protein
MGRLENHPHKPLMHLTFLVFGRSPDVNGLPIRGSSELRPGECHARRRSVGQWA